MLPVYHDAEALSRFLHLIIDSARDCEDIQLREMMQASQDDFDRANLLRLILTLLEILLLDTDSVDQADLAKNDSLLAKAAFESPFSALD